MSIEQTSPTPEAEGHQQAVRFEKRFLTPKFWPLWLWFGLLWLISRLPYRAMRVIGEGVGLLAMKAGKKRRYFAERNLELCFPEKSAAERQRILRESFKGAGMALFESGLVWWPKKSNEALIHFEGFEHIEQLQREGKHILLFAPHVTCVEFCFARMGARTWFNVLFRVHDNPLWEFMATHGRRHYTLRLIPRKRVKEFLYHMNQGELGLIAADQDMGKKRSLFAPFFGIPAATIPSITSFAEQTDAEVVFASAFRRPGEGFTLRFSKPLDNFPSGDPLADCTRTNKIVEDFVREHPEDYLWQHRRFKTRPTGEAALYDRKKR
ncbi:MAG: lipid A biosynthesis lauroyl acyltransferase [Candidatus Pelagadaptatus aseana]|uniref:LpxL/LpxP family acyltransferase n=1 Tax=Candidatus Pelagadaptatus aseana TaxID=3120508 RepID=UPI0039B1A9E2